MRHIRTVSWACALSPQICGTLTKAVALLRMPGQTCAWESVLYRCCYGGQILYIQWPRPCHHGRKQFSLCPSHKPLVGREVKMESQTSLMRPAGGLGVAGTLSSPTKKEHCSLCRESHSIVFCKVLSKCLFLAPSVFHFSFPI